MSAPAAAYLEFPSEKVVLAHLTSALRREMPSTNTRGEGMVERIIALVAQTFADQEISAEGVGARVYLAIRTLVPRDDRIWITDSESVDLAPFQKHLVNALWLSRIQKPGEKTTT